MESTKDVTREVNSRFFYSRFHNCYNYTIIIYKHPIAHVAPHRPQRLCQPAKRSFPFNRHVRACQADHDATEQRNRCRGQSSHERSDARRNFFRHRRGSRCWLVRKKLARGWMLVRGCGDGIKHQSFFTCRNLCTTITKI